MTTIPITAPGVYDDLSNEQYHGNCCDGPSLSHSGAHTLVTKCPAAFWWRSPLNPDFIAERSAKFDIGTAAHLMLLEPDQMQGRIVIIHADEYRKEIYKSQRDEAYAMGLTPLLECQYQQILAMARALNAHPIARKAFHGGKAERSYFWRDPVTRVWLKCRVDYERENGRVLVDYKTTTSAHPNTFARRAWDMGHFSQDPWYRDGIEAVTGRRPEEFWFVVQETEPPYLVSVCKLDGRTQEWGRLLNRKAIDTFARCLETGIWPGYRNPTTPDRDATFEIGLPSFAEYQLQDRHVAGEFEPQQAALEMAMEFSRPL